MYTGRKYTQIKEIYGAGIYTERGYTYRNREDWGSMHKMGLGGENRPS